MVVLVKSMLVFIPKDKYILYQPRRGTYQKHPRSSWSHESSCFTPGVIWHPMEDGTKRHYLLSGHYDK